ncbi:MAG: NUDIX domain-containing protein [Burkholderiales bacterium]|nr:NUDIX domain-containing protein [Anaerolineae bacterium]
MNSSGNIRIQKVETLSDDWYVLKKTTFDYQRKDGTWQTQSRETYDRGNGAAILLYNRARQSILLTRQFRFPAFVNEHDGMLIEVPAGLLEEGDPAEGIRREAEEEAGVRVRDARKVFEAFMSPGSVTERLYFFVAEYVDEDKIGMGGGLEADGEDIETLELSLDAALHMVATGEIIDAKTIMLLQYAKINNLLT